MADKVSDLEIAISVAREAGNVALSHYRDNAVRRHLLVERKRDGSPVSEADRAAERAARDLLSRARPEDGVLGEELGHDRPNAPRMWCIDPIDGTKSFLAGTPLWGSLVALVEGQTVLAGAAYFPVTNELIAAAPGAGCIVEGARAGVSSIAAVEEAVVSTTDILFRDAPACVEPWMRLSQRARLMRTWGDCYGYYLVATGRIELMTDGSLSPWDAACFLPIIEEAGGVVTDWQGKRTAFGKGLIATNRAAAGVLRAELGVVASP